MMNNYQPYSEPNLFYVITQKINTTPFHFETRLLHPWDALINYTYNLKSAIKLQTFNNYDEATEYSNKLRMYNYEYTQLNILLDNCLTRILET